MSAAREQTLHRPSVTKPKAKAKSSSNYSVATTKTALGAPSQHSQGSRKGKRAWRKNVDIGEVEEGLEELRAEERVTGYVFVVSPSRAEVLTTYLDVFVYRDIGLYYKRRRTTNYFRST